MNKISVYIIAYNEGEKIRDAINSVLWADEIVVADSFSQDNTAAIAEEMGARVVQIPFRGFGDLRNRAMEACTHEWIFFAGFRRTLHPGGARRSLPTLEIPAGRCLLCTTAQLFHGPLD